MGELKEKDMEILNLLRETPQGLFLHQIQKWAHLPRKQYAYYYIRKLIKKSLAYKKDQLYFATKEGKEIAVIQKPKSLVQSTKPITSKHTKRPHALQLNAKLFPTSWGRLKPTLDYLQLPYKQLLKGNIIELIYKGQIIRASSQWLYSYTDLPEAPLNITIEEIKEKSIKKLTPLFEAFLAHTGLRCIRDKEGSLLVDVRYWEDGYPGNEIAERSLEDKNRIIYAVDRLTGAPRAWADTSPKDMPKHDPFELETNSEVIDKQMTLFLQAVENGELKPYEDEMVTRENFKLIYATQHSQLQWFRHHDAQIVADTKEKIEITKLIKELRKEKEAQNSKKRTSFRKLPQKTLFE